MKRPICLQQKISLTNSPCSHQWCAPHRHTWRGKRVIHHECWNQFLGRKNIRVSNLLCANYVVRDVGFVLTLPRAVVCGAAIRARGQLNMVCELSYLIRRGNLGESSGKLDQTSLRDFLPRRPRGEFRSAWRAPSTASASAGSSPLATAKEMVGKVFHNMLSKFRKLTSIPCWIISLILAIAFCTLPGSSPWKPIMSIVHSPECFFLQIDYFVEITTST